MSDAHVPHALDDHATDDPHGHDDHGRGGPALGPLDVRTWGMAVLGILLGLIVAIAFLQAAG